MIYYQIRMCDWNNNLPNFTVWVVLKLSNVIYYLYWHFEKLNIDNGFFFSLSVTFEQLERETWLRNVALTRLASYCTILYTNHKQTLPNIEIRPTNVRSLPIYIISNKEDRRQLDSFHLFSRDF